MLKTVFFDLDGTLLPMAQEEFIRELPLPDGMKDMLIENNTLEGYQTLAAESFAEYLSGYIAYGIVNGIAFIISFQNKKSNLFRHVF